MADSDVWKRSTLLFEEGIRSKYTRRNYSSHLARFERFSGLDRVKMMSAHPEDLQRALEDYLIDLKRTANPNSVPSMFRGIKHFCVMNRILLNWDVIYRMFPSPKKPPGLRAYASEDVRKILGCTKNLRDKALIHFLASTGARIGVFDHDLRMEHLHRMPHSCTAVRVYAGEVEEYWTFLTPQASGALEDYHRERGRHGEVIDPDTPLFAVARSNSESRQLGWNGARSAVYRIVSKSGVARRKTGGRYDVQIDHGFRKRFNTTLKLANSVNYNVAEKLMGHKNGLDGVYFTPTLEDLFAEFRKVVRRLEV